LEASSAASASAGFDFSAFSPQANKNKSGSKNCIFMMFDLAQSYLLCGNL